MWRDRRYESSHDFLTSCSVSDLCTDCNPSHRGHIVVHSRFVEVWVVTATSVEMDTGDPITCGTFIQWEK